MMSNESTKNIVCPPCGGVIPMRDYKLFIKIKFVLHTGELFLRKEMRFIRVSSLSPVRGSYSFGK